MKKLFAFTVGSKLLLAALLWSLSPLALSASDLVLIPGGFTNLPAGSPGWSYRLGTSEASSPVAAWRTNTFVQDASWGAGTLPLGYPSNPPNDPNGYEASLITTLPTSTAGNYLSVFLRKTFVVSNRLDYTSIRLGVMVDDGLVAWINGREVMRFQCCIGGGDLNVPTYDSMAAIAIESTPNTNTVANDSSGPLVDRAF